MTRQLILSTCLFVVGIARFAAADTGLNLRREIAWARLRWPSDLEEVRFGSPTKTLLAWVPAGVSIDAWVFSPSHQCDRIELHRIPGTPSEMYGHDLLVGRSIVEKDVRGVEDDVRRGRETRAWRSFVFGDPFSEGGEALSLEERDANGKWQPAGQTGTIGRELATYGVLSYADATVARFGGTHLLLRAECAGPVEWLKCKSGGERPCVGCKIISVVPAGVNDDYGGTGFMWGRRRPTCQDPCPPSSPNPAVARLEELQSHVTAWQPSGEPRANTPSLHRTLASCMRTHYPNGSPAGKSTPVKP